MTHKTIRAKKSLGQNFLIDHEALSDISNSLVITGKHIIEVGPGYGALTDYIMEESPLTIDLVELDIDMVNILEEKFGVKSEELRVKNTIGGHTKNGKTEKDKLSASEDNLQNGGSGVKHCLSDDEILIHDEQSEKERVGFTPETFGTFGHESTKKPFGTFGNKSADEITGEGDGTGDIFNMTETPITLHHQDILTFTPSHERYSVIANIPYYITSPILFHFLYHLPHSPEEMTIMMQSEVGEKILEGRARKPHHSFISLTMEQACEDIEMVRYVGRTSFDPAPKVDSIVLKFTVKSDRNFELEKRLIQLWKVAFAHPRKTLLSNIKGSTYNLEHIRKTLTELGYDERVRAEAMKREDWERLL